MAAPAQGTRGGTLPPGSHVPSTSASGGMVTPGGLTPSPAPRCDEKAVAEFLLSKRFHLAALEFHQELLEANNGLHNVEVLNKFFNDPGNFVALVRSTEAKAKENKANGVCHVMAE